MNKYIIPVFDNEAYQIWNEKISATSLESAKDKLMNKIISDYDIEEDYSDWNDFVENMMEFNIIIGDFEDIETI